MEMTTSDTAVPEEGAQVEPAPSFEERIEQRLTNMDQRVTQLVCELISRVDATSGRNRASVTKTVTEETQPGPLEEYTGSQDESGAMTSVLDNQDPSAILADAQSSTVVKKVTRTVTPVGIEREVFGMWSVMLRNAGGILAATTTCIIAIVNAYTTYMSVTSGHGWPSETTMFIANIGPIVVAWTFMNSSKTISTIMQVRGVQDRLKNAMSGFLSNQDNNRRSTDVDRPDTPPPAPPPGPVPPQY
jgi:hypothetical protein